MLLPLLLGQGTAGPTTHATSGVLTGPGSAVVGAATNFTVHSTSGALTGQIGSVVGSAARTGGAVTHATTGTLTGQGSSIVGAASNFTPHATSGALTGQGSTLAGSAARTRVHPSSGVLAGPGSSVVGAASNFTPHSTSGALVGSGSVVDGAASRSSGAVSHDTSGDLVGIGAAFSGNASIGVVVRRHAGSKRGYIFKGQKYWLTQFELAQLIRDEQARIQDVQRLKRNKPKTISAESFKAIERIIDSLNLPVEPQPPTIDNDDDETIELLLTL